MDENATQAPPPGNIPAGKGIQTQKNRIYPELVIPYSEHPNRLYAFPVLAFFIKLLSVLPQAIILMFLTLFVEILWVITPFVILFTGKCWDPMYKYGMVYVRFYTKIYQYLWGLTDKYPGFSIDEDGRFTLTYDKPAKSSRLLGFPLLGFLIRVVLLIPFFIWGTIVGAAAGVAVAFSWFAVLFTGRYPESLYEIIRDYFRIFNATSLYMFYLSDTYPSFRISMNHKVIKIILLILGLLVTFFDYSSDFSHNQPSSTSPSYNYSSPTPNYGN